MDTEYDDDTSISQRNAQQGAQVLQVESNRLVPVLVALSSMALLIAGIGLGVGCWSLSYADKARMESRILQVKVEGFENALHARGIDPNPHLKGERE